MQLLDQIREFTDYAGNPVPELRRSRTHVVRQAEFEAERDQSLLRAVVQRDLATLGGGHPAFQETD